MGAENSILQDCQWGPQVACPPKFPWEMSPVTTADGTSATVFEPKDSDNKNEGFLKHFATTLRGLRHPNIIRFIGSGQSSDGFWLATEPVFPLFSFVSDMSSQEICAGLNDILHGLEFLHSKLGVCHNNICLLSIYISSDGSWKLGGLEHACQFVAATQEFLDQCRPHRHEESLSPEEKTNRVNVVDKSAAYARDVFAFGILVDSILGLVKEKDRCAQMLEQQLSQCLLPDPTTRPTVTYLLSLSVFKSDLIEILDFLRHITAKSSSEKQEFFSNLVPRMYQLPEIAIARRLVVPLLARFVLLDEWAVLHVLPHLLTPKGSSCKKTAPFVQGLLSEHLFRQFIINHIYNIFHVYDSHIRLVLLEHFSHFVNMFTRQQLENDIFLQVLLGVRDTDDRLVAASLRALADLVPVLGGDVVVGGARKPFFFHGMPKQTSTHQLANAPHNKMVSFTDQKPLLKHLALSSQLNIEKNLGEKEKKMREREKRKVDAKLRREERRNQQEKDKDGHIKGNTVQDISEGQRSEIITEVVNDECEIAKVKVVDGEVESLLVNSVLDPDWSDWEDVDHKINVLDLDDDLEISEQIEIELQAMPGKVHTSPSPYRSQSPPSPPPVKVDWSHVEDIQTNKVTTSRTTSTIQSRPVNDPDTSRWTNNGQETTRQQTVAHNKLSLQPSVTANGRSELNGSSTAKQKSGNSTSTDDLGAGLDIKSINIVRRSTEFDFFADMVPVIVESNPIHRTDLVLSSMSDETATVYNPASSSDNHTETIKSQLFNVMPCSDEEVKGWGEDDNLFLDNEIQGVIETDT